MNVIGKRILAKLYAASIKNDEAKDVKAGGNEGVVDQIRPMCV